MTSGKLALNRLVGRFSDSSSVGNNPREHLRRLDNYGRHHQSLRDVSVHFDDIEDAIVENLKDYDAAVGAIAWLTNRRLLEALSKLNRVAIVVQKEDFLRRDTNEPDSKFKLRLREQYSNLTGYGWNDFLNNYPGQQEGMQGFNDNAQSWLLAYHGLLVGLEEPIRCLGYRREEGDSRTPIMHHKFIVAGDFLEDRFLYPRCVMTGSFNWSQNATSSRENLVIMRDAEIGADFVAEWAQLWSLSEPLDWSSKTPKTPIHNIGT